MQPSRTDSRESGRSVGEDREAKSRLWGKKEEKSKIGLQELQIPHTCLLMKHLEHYST